MLKTIIDTNLWISFLIGKKLKGLEKLLDTDKFQLITSEEQISEFLEVINKPKLQKYFSRSQAIEFLKLIEDKSFITDHKGDIIICRDIKDNFLLNMAVNSKADYLLTGDSDLLIIGKIEKTQIINFVEFEKKYM